VATLNKQPKKDTSTPHATSKSLKILYIGNFHPKSVGEPEIANALEKLGHTVIRHPNTERPGTLDADILLFSKLTFPGHINFLRELKIPRVCWMFDLYWGYRNEKRIEQNKEQLFQADLVLTTDGGNTDKWKKHNINHKCLRQGIAEDVTMGSPNFATVAEIGFVGTRSPWAGWDYRPALIDWLKATYGTKFKHFGQDGSLRHEDLNDLYATLKIVVGDTVHSPNYWSNRIYETIGRGGFLIHPLVEGIEKEFTPYKHFIPYNYGDMAGLREKINYYLQADEEREKIRQAGFEHCHKYHTYTKRARQLIDELRRINVTLIFER